MPRRARSILGGYVYHVLNRANGGLRLFKKDQDFAAFEATLAQALERTPLRILGYVLMSNHWHFLVWPKRGDDEGVSEFFRWLTVTHAQRWHAHNSTSGTGHVYQGRFKSFPVASDEHLLTVLRYIERNPLRANLVRRAEAWRWGSLYRRAHGARDEQVRLAELPVPVGPDWIRHVNDPQNDAELAAIRRCVSRGQPFGHDRWQTKIAQQLGLEHTFRSPGRPRRQPIEQK